MSDRILTVTPAHDSVPWPSLDSGYCHEILLVYSELLQNVFGLPRPVPEQTPDFAGLFGYDIPLPAPKAN